MRFYKRLGVSICFMMAFICLPTIYGNAAPLSDPIVADGESCAPLEDGSIYCYDMVLTFEVVGGQVSAEGVVHTNITQNGITVILDSQLFFEGEFEGGDGGEVQGIWWGSSTLTLPEGEKVSSDASGTWVGNLYASGEGGGTWQGGTINQDGWWSVSYPSTDFIAALPTPEFTATVPAPSATSPPAAALVQASPSVVPPTEVQPTQPAVVVRAEEDTPPQEKEAFIAQVQEAAGNPAAPIAGGVAGGVIGGLLAYLAARAGALGGSSIDTMQSAAGSLRQPLEDAAQSTSDVLEGISDQVAAVESASNLEGAGLEHAEELQQLGQGLSNAVQVYGTGSSVADAAPSLTGGSPMDSRQDSMNVVEVPQSLGDNVMRILNIVNSDSQIRGDQIKKLKNLGPASLAMGIGSRFKMLSEKRGDEPFLYEASTFLEAATIETVKYVSTKNPYLAILDNATGVLLQKNPSDIVCDGASDLMDSKLYEEVMLAESTSGGKYGKKHNEDMQEFFREEVRKLRTQYDEGEIPLEEFKSRARAHRLDYMEYSEKITQTSNSWWGD